MPVQFIVPPEMVNQPMDPDQLVTIRGDQIPGWRNTAAYRRGVRENLLLRAGHGIGDQICSEATIRWAIEEMGYAVSLTAPAPELYRHLHSKMKRVHNYKKDPPLDESKFYLVDLMAGGESLAYEFHCHMNMNCVDYSSICAFRSQMPIQYRAVQLHPDEKAKEKIEDILVQQVAGHPWVLIHPGRHWPMKTFPTRWWNHVIRHLIGKGVLPVIIGGHAADTDSTRSTVDVYTEGCLDLRRKLELMESVYLTQRARVLLTNDSAPLHMAVTGPAWIGFLTLAKHPDHLTHYRKPKDFGERNWDWVVPVYGWRMENLSRGGIWEKKDMARIDVAKIEKPNYDDWLPEPESVAKWALAKLHGFG